MKLPNAVKKRAEKARQQHAAMTGGTAHVAALREPDGEFLDVSAISNAPAPGQVRQVASAEFVAPKVVADDAADSAPNTHDNAEGFVPHALANVLDGGHPSAANVAAIGIAPRDLSDPVDPGNDTDSLGQQASRTPDFIAESDWEGRYKALRASRGEELDQLGQQNSDLKANLATLQAQLNELSADGPSAAPRFELDDDTRARLGEDQAKVFDQFNASLEERFARDDERQQAAAQRDHQSFRSNLTSMVPRWEEINDTPAFHAWLSQVDETLGMRRQDVLDRFVSTHDAESVAALFRSFASRSSDAQQRNSHAPSLEIGATRASAGLDAADNMVEVWGQTEIADFYRTKSRLSQAGKLKGETKAKVEAEETRIRKAMEEGRVDMAA